MNLKEFAAYLKRNPPKPFDAEEQAERLAAACKAAKERKIAIPTNRIGMTEEEMKAEFEAGTWLRGLRREQKPSAPKGDSLEE